MPDALSELRPASAVESAMVGELDDDGLVRVFEALSSTMRLRMLRQLAREAAVCACGFEVQATIGQSTVSYHLRVLREAGLVKADRSGSFVHYALEPGAVERIGLAITSLRSQLVSADPGPRCCEADGPSDLVTCDPRPPQP